jgi:hypothetical protein
MANWSGPEYEQALLNSVASLEREEREQLAAGNEARAAVKRRRIGDVQAELDRVGYVPPETTEDSTPLEKAVPEKPSRKG